MFLKLSGQIEGQLRDAYDKKFRAGTLTQASLGDKIGVNRSSIHRRLSGGANMTVETIADMIWGLEHDFEFKLLDPAGSALNWGGPKEDTPVPPPPKDAPTPPKKSEPITGEIDPAMKQMLEEIISKRHSAPVL
jgi:hypothetical protein